MDIDPGLSPHHQENLEHARRVSPLRKWSPLGGSERMMRKFGPSRRYANGMRGAIMFSKAEWKHGSPASRALFPPLKP